MAVSIAPPNSSEALLEELSTPEKAAQIFGNPEKLKTWLVGYVKASNEADPDLQGQLSEAQSRAMIDFLTKNGYAPLTGKTGRLPMSADVANGKSGGHAAYRGIEAMGEWPRLDRTAILRQIAATGRGPGIELVDQFEGFADLLKTSWHGYVQRHGLDARLKDLGEGAGDQGGFLVPEEFRAELLRMTLESAVVRPRARVIPMGGPVVRYPAIRDASHASTVFGGVSGRWAAEAGSVSSSTNEPTFAQVALTAKKLTGYTVVSNELLNDSAIALEAVLMQLFAEALSFFEDDSFIAGVGGGQPVGILNADALVSVAKETGQAATTIVWENIIKMFSRLLPSSLMRSIWYAHPDTFPALATMSLAVGTGGAPVWINNGASGPPMTILGRPVVFTEKAETLGTAGDMVLSDMSYYLIGDRQSLAIANSPHVLFTTDQTVWRFIQRVDGRPWIDTALTPRNGTNTMSPFVALATRA